MLHQRLESAIDRLYRLPEDATRTEPGLPNLGQGLAKSAEYLQSTDSRYAAWAVELRDRASAN